MRERQLPHNPPHPQPPLCESCAADGAAAAIATLPRSLVSGLPPASGITTLTSIALGDVSVDLNNRDLANKLLGIASVLSMLVLRERRGG